ncbi:MAG TPA: RdgB/HAM1 family non-canonical purine NTP pyrophosphatase [Kineobactrum sp.]
MAATPGTVVLASSNKGKLAELARILEPLAMTLRVQSEFGVGDADETGLTFVENAIIKARAAAEYTGLPAIADDSGLEVDYLQGAPGIHSARYSGEGDTANNAKLLAALAGVPEAQRSARYQCVLVYMRHALDPTPVICQGSWEGRILQAPSGSGGFGYDPIFYVTAAHCSAAELDSTTKNRVSHRALACAQLAQALRRA